MRPALALAALGFSLPLHAEIAAPPSIPEKSPALQETPSTPSNDPGLSPQGFPSQMAAPIEFDEIEVDLVENPNYASGFLASGASVEALQNEMDQAIAAGDALAAEKAFNEVLRAAAPDKQKRTAILKMGRFLEENHKQPAKAAVVYEQYVKLFPQDEQTPDVLLRLGKIYRNAGAYASALNKFYSVLYSALQVKTGDQYTDSSLRAKMEIAHTHFAAGDYQQAAQLYDRLKLVKMTPQEASEVAFRSAYIAFLAGSHNDSLNAAQAFLETYPTSPLAPEAQYLRIQSLKALGRSDEAMKETIKLLQAGREYGKKKPAVWAYWQRKTGNDIANDLYESGDALGALTVYQKLAELNDAPNWRGPTVYQIGLCFERLRHTARAKEAYRYIIEKIPVTGTGTEADPMIGTNLSTLRDMAQWRLENLEWLEKTEKDLFPLLDKNPAGDDLQPAFLKAQVPSPTQQAANQIAPSAATR